MSNNKKRNYNQKNKTVTRNGRVYPTKYDTLLKSQVEYQERVNSANEMSHPLWSIIGLFLRNKLVEIVKFLLTFLWGAILTILGGIVIFLALAGIGKLLHYIPQYVVLFKPLSYGASTGSMLFYYMASTLPLIVIIIGAISIFALLVLMITGISEWISSNWQLAKKGTKVTF